MKVIFEAKSSLKRFLGNSQPQGAANSILGIVRFAVRDSVPLRHCLSAAAAAVAAAAAAAAAEQQQQQT